MQDINIGTDEKEILSENAKFKLLLNSCNDIISIVDNKARTIWANAAWKKAFGDDINIKNPFVKVHPDDAKKVFKAWKSLTNKEKLSINIECKTADLEGNYHHFDVSANKTNKLTYVFAHDVTEKIKTKKDIAREKNRFKTYVDLARVIMIAIDTQGITTYINKKGCEVLKCRKEDIIGKDWFNNFLPGRIRKKVKVYSKKLLRGDAEPVDYFENHILCKDKEERLIGWHNILLKDDKENIIGHLSSGEDITEKKKAELSLKRNEEKIRTIVENSKDIIYSADIEGNVTFIEGGESWTGYSSKEIIGQNIKDYVHPDDYKHVIGEIKKEITTGLASETICRLKTKKGYVWVEESGKLIYKKGKPVGFKGTIRDITERKKAEKDIMESERKFRSLFDNSHDIISICDKKAVPIIVNKAWKKIFGRIEDYKEVFSRLHPDDLKKISVAWNNMVKKNKPFKNVTYRYKDKLGNYRVFETYASLLQEPGKGLYVTIAKDITERKKSEKHLKESEEKYRSLFDNESDAVMIFDATTKIFEDANQATLRLFGYTKEEFLRLTAEDISAEKEKTRIAVNYMIKNKTNKKIVPERKLLKKDGTIFIGEIHTGSFITHGKKKIIGSIRDITERKRSEDALKEKNAQLQKFAKLSIGREKKMIELKEQLNKVLEKE